MANIMWQDSIWICLLNTCRIIRLLSNILCLIALSSMVWPRGVIAPLKIWWGAWWIGITYQNIYGVRLLKLPYISFIEFLVNLCLKYLLNLWTGRKPSLNHLRVWGCPTEVRIYNPIEKKPDPKTSCCFIGYLEHAKGYKFYNPGRDNKIIELLTAKF